MAKETSHGCCKISRASGCKSKKGASKNENTKSGG